MTKKLRGLSNLKTCLGEIRKSSPADIPTTYSTIYQQVKQARLHDGGVHL